MVWIKNHRSFTLIELLVAIAVMGLIAALVLVSLDLPKRRTQARTAKSLEFSQSLQHVLGAYAVGIWSFDEGPGSPTAYDASGYGNDGTINGGASYTPDTPHAVVGTSEGRWALSFDGVDDYVNAGLSNTLSPTSITLEAWFNTNTTAGRKYIVARGTGGAGRAYELQFDDQNKLNGGLYYDDGSGSGYNLQYTGTINTGTWYHVVVTHDGSQSKLYVNGVLNRTYNKVANLNSPVTNTIIGAYGGVNSGWFNGAIDEVRIYNRALTATQIQKHYTEGLEKFKLVEKHD